MPSSCGVTPSSRNKDNNMSYAVLLGIALGVLLVALRVFNVI